MSPAHEKVLDWTNRVTSLNAVMNVFCTRLRLLRTALTFKLHDGAQIILRVKGHSMILGLFTQRR